MNDYLTNLLVTNLDAAPIFQPRVAALFEPASGGELNAGESVIYTRARDDSKVSTPSNETRPVPPQPLIVVKREEPKGNAFKAPEDSLRPSGAWSTSPRAAKSQPHPEASSPVQAQPLPEQDVPASSRATVDPTRELDPSAEQRGAVIFRPEVRVIAEPSRRLDVTPARDNAASEPPVIRVTIGSVQVHAEQAPAPRVPKKKDTPPRMSLEEYLARRAR